MIASRFMNEIIHLKNNWFETKVHLISFHGGMGFVKHWQTSAQEDISIHLSFNR
jgi:hypothetical protein